MNTKEILTPEEQESYLYKALRQQSRGASEKEIETELYALLLQYYQRRLTAEGEVGVASYSNPHRIDGLLTISTLEKDQRVLIEAKTHRSLASTGVWAPLAQALQYTHLLQQLGELLPGLILIATEREWHAVQVDTLVPLLSRAYLPWEATPSKRTPPIEKALRDLSPTLLSFKLNASLDLNNKLEGITSLLRNSSHCSSKQYGEVSTLFPILGIDPATHIYHGDRSQWWVYQEDRHIWNKTPQRAISLSIREQFEAIENTIPAGISSLCKIAIEDGKVACSVDEWPSNDYSVNTPEGSWNVDLGAIEPATSDEGHRYCTGLVGEDSEVIKSDLSNVLASVFDTLLHNISRRIIVAVTPDEYIASQSTALLSSALGSYAMTGTLGHITSKWSWNPDSGDAPVLLVNEEISSISESRFSSSIREYLNRSYFNRSLVLLFISERSYRALGNIINYTEWMDTTEVKSIGEVSSASLLYSALKLLKSPIILTPYINDPMYSWFNECLKKEQGSYVLIEDLRDSYNAWLQEHGYVAIAHKSFVDRLSNHEVFMDEALAITRSRVAKLTHSPWEDTGKKMKMGYTARTPGVTPTHVKDIAFK